MVEPELKGGIGADDGLPPLQDGGLTIWQIDPIDLLQAGHRPGAAPPRRYCATRPITRLKPACPLPALRLQVAGSESITA